jgi:hypothetical protein
LFLLGLQEKTPIQTIPWQKSASLASTTAIDYLSTTVVHTGAVLTHVYQIINYIFKKFWVKINKYLNK